MTSLRLTQSILFNVILFLIVVFNVSHVAQAHQSDKFFQDYISTSHSNDRLSFKELISDENYRMALVQSYYYLFKYDEESQKILESCIAGSDACFDVVNLSTYNKLRAYRSYLENIEHKMEQSFLRLIDVYESFENKHALVLTDNVTFLNHLDQLQQNHVIKNVEKTINQLTIYFKEFSSDSSFSHFIEFTLSLHILRNLHLSFENYQESFSIRFNKQWSKDSSKIASLYFMDEEFLDNYEQMYLQFYRSHKEQLQKSIASSLLVLEPASVLAMYDKIINQHHTSPLDFTGKGFADGDWALTYDDGPHSKYTDKILETLSDYNTHATFFWLASKVEKYRNEEVVENAKQLSMSIGNHSYHHGNLNKPDADLDTEILGAKYKIEHVIGDFLNYFRLPYGSGRKNSDIKKRLQEGRLYHFFWTVDSLDWKDPDPVSVFERIDRHMQKQKRGIILLHDIQRVTVKTSELLLQHVHNEGIKIRPLTNIMQELGRKPANYNLRPQSIYDDEFSLKKVFPQYRQVTVNALNVRSSPSIASDNICGYLPINSEIRALGHSENKKWFLLNYKKNKIIKKAQSKCDQTSVGFVSTGSRFSRKR